MAERTAPPRRGRAGGFTLIEVLIALAILAIALGALVAETSHYISNTARLQDRTLAHWIAANRVAELQVGDVWPTAGTSNGTVEFAGREWAWTVIVSDTPDESIRRVDVEVRAERGRERADGSAIAYLERPTP